jgi:hypothetical protein
VAWGDFVAHGVGMPSPAAAAAWVALIALACCGAAAAEDSGPQPGDAAVALAWGLVIAGVLNTLIALVQAAGWADALFPLAAHSPDRHAFGNLRQKNHFATLAAMALVAAAWLALRARSHGPVWILLVVGTLLTVGIAASSSRMGALQWLAALGITAAWLRGRGHSVVWLGAPALAFVAGALIWLLFEPSGAAAPSLLRRLALGEPGCVGRLVLWSNVADLALDRPWTGWGWRELSHALYMQDVTPRFCAMAENAHNLPLHLAAELGMPVAAAALALLTWAIVRSHPWNAATPGGSLGWSVVLLVGLHSLVEYPLWYGPFLLTTGLALGLVAPRGWVVSSRVSWTAAAILGAIALHLAWDHWRVSQLFRAPQDRAAGYQEDTLEKVRGTWWFRDHADFAELFSKPLVPETAERVHDLAKRTLHFSPEPRVIEKEIRSLELLGRNAEAQAASERYRRAYPAAWSDSTRQ